MQLLSLLWRSTHGNPPVYEKSLPAGGCRPVVGTYGNPGTGKRSREPYIPLGTASGNVQGLLGQFARASITLGAGNKAVSCKEGILHPISGIPDIFGH